MIHAWLLILLPLATSAVIAFRGRRMNEPIIGTLACGSVGAAFVVALVLFLQLARAAGGTAVGHGSEVFFAGLLVAGPTWISAGSFNVPFSLWVDPLSVIMALVVSGVGFAIHCYARGYMHGEEHFARFFALLNLFIGMMMILVMAENLLLTFIGWEGVGFCSYMLIGYYTEKHSAAQAGKKAFLVNRVGDLGFLLGSIVCFQTFGTLSYPELAQKLAGGVHLGAVGGACAAIAALLFVGACGKSAQFPLHVWLPDAMEGPTPVSALIHAATMVTAGVFLVVRMGAIYAAAPVVLTVVAIIGLITALLAATMAIVQQDIKKVLAYSTISQLGYMFLAAGVGAYTAAIFHLVTHAFFKGLLFLCSGSVIHAVEHGLHHAGEHEDPQDMRNMGGLAQKLPITHWTMVVGSAALAGIPGLAGFFSKDEILFRAGIGGAEGLGNAAFRAIGILVAALTALYMTRLLAKTFWQQTRLSDKAFEGVHESPREMTTPLLSLAVLSVIGGALNFPAVGLFKLFAQKLEHWLEPVTQTANHLLFGPHLVHDPAGEVQGMLLSGAIAIAAVALGAWLYRKPGGLMTKLAGRVPEVYETLLNLYYVDDFFKVVLLRPGERLSEWLASTVDQGVIDGTVNGVAAAVGRAADGGRLYQPGLVRSYALWFAVGAVIVTGVLAIEGSAPWAVALVGVLLLALLGSAAVAWGPRNEG